MWRRFLSRDASRAWQVNRIAATASPGEQYQMHRVRFRPSRNIIRKAVGYGTTAVVCFFVWDIVAFWPIRNLDKDAEEELDKKEELESWFIPVPFTEKLVQPLPYNGSGEEWQQFMKFNKDEKRAKQVKHELIQYVKSAAEKHPITKRWADKKEGFRVGPTWLVYTYPSRPPPEVVRRVIEWDDEGIWLKYRPLDSRTKAILDRVLMPSPMIHASYAFAQALVKQNVDAVTKFFGYTPEHKQITAARIDPDMSKLVKSADSHRTAHAGSDSSSSPERRSEPPTSDSDTSPHSSAMKANTAGSSRDPSKPVDKNVIPFYSTIHNETSGPWQAFRQTFAKTYKPLECYPPRGSLGLHGMISLDGPRGRVYIDVSAFYHPQTSEFHKESLVMRIRTITPSTQRPLRP